MAGEQRDGIGQAFVPDPADRLQLLLEVSELLSGSLDYDASICALARFLVPRFGDGCVIDVVASSGAIRRAVVELVEPEKAALAVELKKVGPPDPSSPNGILKILERGRAVLVPSFDERELASGARDPEHLRILTAIGPKAGMIVPLVAPARALGVLWLIITRDDRRYGPSDLALAQDLSRRVALAIDRARVYDELAARENTQRFLAEASAALSSSLDDEPLLRTLTGLAVPRIADWCTVWRCGDDGRLRQVGVAHADPAKAIIAGELADDGVFGGDDAHGPRAVVRTGEPELLDDLRAALAGAGSTDARSATIAALGLTSAVTVPMTVRGKIIGALSMARAGSARFAAPDVGLAEDLARRAALAIDNARLYREARDAVLARDAFLSIASHELKTPLTALQLQVQSIAHLLEVAPGELRPDIITTKLATADRQLKRLTRLMNDLLDVSRMSSGRLELRRETMDLSAMARGVVKRLGATFANAGCRVTIDAPTGVVGRWDRMRIEQVLTNLLSNATKYGAGKPIDVSVSSSEGRARLSVADHGIGIAGKDHHRIFQRFERAVSERHYGGLGIGLWIASQIIEAHEGTMAVESEAGIGATFSVELPGGVVLAQ